MKLNGLTRIAFLVVILLAGMRAPAPVFAQEPGKVAFTGRDGNIYLYNTDGSGLEPITTDGYLRPDPAGSDPEVEYMNLHWSPDGRRLAAVRQASEPKPDRLLMTTTVVVYDLQTHAWTQIGKELNIFTWNPAGTALVYGSRASGWGNKGPLPPYGGIMQYDLTNGQESEILPAQNKPLNYPSFSRTGRYLAFYETIAMEGLGNFGLYDFQTQQKKIWQFSDNFTAASLNWAADDSFVVFDQNTYTPLEDSKIYRASPSFEDVTAISPAVDGRNFYGPRLSPNQERVLAMSDRVPPEGADTAYGALWIFNIDGSQARELVNATAPVYAYQWLGDGYVVYSTGDYRQETVQIVDTDTGQVQPLGRGRDFAVQPGAVRGSAQPSPLPGPTNTPFPAAEVIPVVTPTQSGLVQASTPVPMPPDRVVPPAPAWFTPRTLAILLCGGSLALLGVVLIVFLVLRRK